AARRRYGAGIESGQHLKRQARFKSRTVVRSRGAAIRGGCSPQNNLRKLLLEQKNHRPPHPSGRERRLFPPEQSSKASTLLNGFRVDGNKFRLNFSAVIYAEFDNNGTQCRRATVCEK